MSSQGSKFAVLTTWGLSDCPCAWYSGDSNISNYNWKQKSKSAFLANTESFPYIPVWNDYGITATFLSYYDMIDSIPTELSTYNNDYPQYIIDNTRISPIIGNPTTATRYTYDYPFEGSLEITLTWTWDGSAWRPPPGEYSDGDNIAVDFNAFYGTSTPIDGGTIVNTGYKWVNYTVPEGTIISATNATTSWSWHGMTTTDTWTDAALWCNGFTLNHTETSNNGTFHYIDNFNVN